MGIARESGYSALVDLYLIIDGNRYAVGKVNDKTLYLADDTQLPENLGDVTLVVEIDGQRDESPIVIHRQAGDDRLIHYF